MPRLRPAVDRPLGPNPQRWYASVPDREEGPPPDMQASALAAAELAAQPQGLGKMAKMAKRGKGGGMGGRGGGGRLVPRVHTWDPPLVRGPMYKKIFFHNPGLNPQRAAAIHKGSFDCPPV